MDLTLYPKRMKIRWRWDGQDGDFITYQNPATGAISIMNPVGALIFAKCDGEHSVQDIVDTIMGEFDAPEREQVQQQVTEFVKSLVSIGAVRLLKG